MSDAQVSEVVGEVSAMLTKDQANALGKLVSWFEVPQTRERQYITLGGYAGTGKTFLVAQLCRALNALDEDVRVRVHFCAYTMKAASVLRRSLASQGLEVNDGRRKSGGGSKSGYPVTTIHGLLYAPRELVWCARSGDLLGEADGEEPRAQVCGSPDCDVMLDQTRGTGRTVVCPTRTEIEWSRRMGGPTAEVIVLDEASMVPKEAWEDILSLGLPVIAIGDHGQLPPIKSAFALMSGDVDLRLEEITRQGKDSAIITLAAEVRGWAGRGEAAAYGLRDSRPVSYVAKIRRDELGSLPASLGDGSDPVWVCGYNRTRSTWNGLLRAQKGLSGQVAIGDRVICLKNTLQTYNGQLATVLSVAEVSGRPGVVELELEPEEPLEREARGGAPIVVQVPLEQFGRERTMTTDDLVMGGYKGCQLWDFGYVLTVHKAQGSTFNNVVVLEERLPGSDADFKRWLYTAVTRARHSVVIVK